MEVIDCWYKQVCKKYNTDKCNDMCIRFTEMHHLMKYSGIPTSWFHSKPLLAIPVDIEAYKKLNEIKLNIKDFVSQGRNLYIYSEGTGNGKTTWAVKLLQSYFDKIWAGNGLRIRGFFIPTQAYLIDKKTSQFNSKSPEDMLFSIRDDFGNDLLTTKNVINADVVIWDDFAIKTLSSYDYTSLFAILDQRYLNGKSNIFTSGVDLGALDILCGSKISSRIKMNCDVIQLKGADFRTSTASEGSSTLNG